MAIIRKYIKVLFLLMLPVYFFIVQQSIMNKHTHFYANGIVVTHSHPIDNKNGDPINQHHHSKTEICFFHTLQFEYFILSSGVELPANQLQFHENYVVSNELIEFFRPSQQYSLRAPPVSIL